MSESKRLRECINCKHVTGCCTYEKVSMTCSFLQILWFNPNQQPDWVLTPSEIKNSLESNIAAHCSSFDEKPLFEV